MTELTLHRNKSVGQVIYIVEGDRTEHELLEYVFTEILGYSVISYNRRNGITFYQGDNRYSRVFVVSAAHPSIANLSEDGEYYSSVYELFSIEYGLDTENSAVYFLFDRDRQSNRPRHIEPELEKHGSSRDSDGYEMNGLFLLSYPSIEAFLSTANGDEHELESGNDAKRYIREQEYAIVDLDEEKLLAAAETMVFSIETLTSMEFVPSLLDDFGEINRRILHFEDRKWAADHRYRTLSLLALSFIDLGIISSADNWDD